MLFSSIKCEEIDNCTLSQEECDIEVENAFPENPAPMIGVLTQPYNETHDYIMGAYVKFVQQAGARVVPIWRRESDEKILSLVEKLNGIVYPGGGTLLANPDGSLTDYSKKGKLILDKVKQINDEGTYYPIWAICLGFQELTVIEAPYEGVLLRHEYNGMDQPSNVTFVADLQESRMYKDMPEHLIHALETEDVTYNWHHDGVLPSTYQKYEGLQNYTVLALAYDKNAKVHVASVEHKTYPIYSHQYHPEKNAFIFVPALDVPRADLGIEIGQYYARFFISEARKNFNHFDSVQEEFDHMIEHEAYIIEDLEDGQHQDIYVFELAKLQETTTETS